VYLAVVRGTHPPAWRVLSFLGGCVVLVAAFVTPLDTLAREYLVWAHLLQNVVLAEWTPLLLVLGVPPEFANRPARIGDVRALATPLVALPLWVATYLVWHVPTLYDAALRRPDTLLVLEHATYLLSGLALWWCVWQSEPHRVSAGGRAAYVLGAFVFSGPLGLVLALLPEPVYDAYADAPERVWGLDRLADQQLGGMTMAAEQSAVFFAVFAFWLLRFLAEQEHHSDDELHRS
jgi:putative membrane protein